MDEVTSAPFKVNPVQYEFGWWCDSSLGGWTSAIPIFSLGDGPCKGTCSYTSYKTTGYVQTFSNDEDGQTKLNAAITDQVDLIWTGYVKNDPTKPYTPAAIPTADANGFYKMSGWCDLNNGEGMRWENRTIRLYAFNGLECYVEVYCLKDGGASDALNEILCNQMQNNGIG